MHNIIGLTGHMQSGKDSVAGYLADYGYKRVGFADAVKDMALAIDPIVIPKPGGLTERVPIRLSEAVRIMTWEGAKQEPEVRRLLQALGTEAGRGILGSDIWIRVLERKIFPTFMFNRDGLRPEIVPQRYVIADVRFPNEAAFVQGWGSEVWRVERPGFDGDNHASETQVDEIKVNRVIRNGGSLEDLKKLVRMAVRAMGYAL